MKAHRWPAMARLAHLLFVLASALAVTLGLMNFVNRTWCVRDGTRLCVRVAGQPVQLAFL
jgi:hypothetical protein